MTEQRWKLKLGGILVVGNESVTAVLSSLFFDENALNWIFSPPKGHLNDMTMATWDDTIPPEVSAFLADQPQTGKRFGGLLAGFAVEIFLLNKGKEVFCLKVRPEGKPDSDEREQRIAEALHTRRGVEAAILRIEIPSSNEQFRLDVLQLRNLLNRGAPCITLGTHDLAGRIMQGESPILLGHSGGNDYLLQIAHAGDRQTWKLSACTITGDSPARSHQLLRRFEDPPAVQVIIRPKPTLWRSVEQAELERHCQRLAEILNL